VARHYYKCINDKSFVLLTVFQTVNHNIHVTFTGEDINPIHNGKCQVVGFELIAYFVAFVHDRVKIKILGITEAFVRSGCYGQRF